MSSQFADFPSSRTRRHVNQRKRVSKALRVPMIAGGAALAALGIKRRSLLGAGMAAGGGLLIYRGITARGGWPSTLICVRKSITIDRPAEELYRFWREFENLPRFMRHLQSVRSSGGHLVWVTSGPLGKNFSWEAEIVEERENELISWRSLPGSQIENQGAVRFEAAPEGRGTEVRVELLYRPPAGRVGAAFAMLFGEEPEQQIREDLRRFKQLMEAGEIPTTDGQPHGRRSKVTNILKSVSSFGRSDQEMNAQRVVS
ncbi:MAG TPA: SRPBCC family protein [Terriglobales bacterium]|nr:SRPBCC family protein [Terriglobales bacterium]